ncbi:SMEK domain-containing protein [Stenotrophomonas sp.]|uniref:SMEK domain-containing protein n=1 Tax=Stenotrophomonas sp. TaxID=69392 RepID=UPI0028B114B2|nr:SMEK domain-containing protein [Stenotrophomonas sp.]
MIEALINNLTSDISLIQKRVDVGAKVGFSNMSRLLETMTPPIFRALKIADLVNMNQIKVNFPAIDAADDIRRVAVQVTSNATPAKIRKTLDSFTKKDNAGKSLLDRYDTLYIFGFCKISPPKVLPAYCKVVDPGMLTSLLIDLNDENAIQATIDAVRMHSDYASLHPYNDVDCLKIMLSHINRGAITHRMIQEGSIDQMTDGLRELTELIGTGKIKRSIKSKALHEFKDPLIELFLRGVLDNISRIRAIVHESNRQGYLQWEVLQGIDEIKRAIASSSQEIANKHGIEIKIEMY